METVQGWIILVCVALLLVIHWVLLRAAWRMHQSVLQAWSNNLKTLITEWNKVTQTINALINPLPEGESPRTGHLRGQEMSSESPDTTGAGGGISPKKAELYRRART